MNSRIIRGSLTSAGPLRSKVFKEEICPPRVQAQCELQVFSFGQISKYGLKSLWILNVAFDRLMVCLLMGAIVLWRDGNGEVMKRFILRKDGGITGFRGMVLGRIGITAEAVNCWQNTWPRNRIMDNLPKKRIVDKYKIYAIRDFSRSII